MSECPLNGFPCPHKQNISLPVLKQNKPTEVTVCETCPFRPENVHEEILIPCSPMKLLELAIQQQLVDANTIHCQGCGLSMMELHNTGKMGCEHCYQYFHDLMTELVLPKAHAGANSHKGKRPKIGIKKDEMATITKSKVDLTDVLELLERKLKEAVTEERYENAAILRDIIKQIVAQKDALK